MGNGKGDDLSLLEELVFKLDLLLRKLSELEKVISKAIGTNSDINPAASLIMSTTTFQIAYESTLRVLKLLTKFKGLDPISKTIIQVLSSCQKLSIMSIYREVKRIRGKGSRRIISQKLRILEAMNIVINTGSEKRPKYMLKECVEKE
ncbi:MAG: hypothetical protein ACPLQS_04185 [Desulfurococcaceae archaeon]